MNILTLYLIRKYLMPIHVTVDLFHIFYFFFFCMAYSLKNLRNYDYMSIIKVCVKCFISFTCEIGNAFCCLYSIYLLTRPICTVVTFNDTRILSIQTRKNTNFFKFYSLPRPYFKISCKIYLMLSCHHRRISQNRKLRQ